MFVYTIDGKPGIHPLGSTIMPTALETLLAKHSTTINSLAEYAATVEEIRVRWRKAYDHQRAWFRGHQNKTWELRPRAHREPFRSLPPDVENHHFNEFRRRAIGLLDPPPKTEWGWLYLAQHHGLPTRFLDWSEGSLTALFFALQRAPGASHVPPADPCVWILNPWRLNQAGWGFSSVVTMTQAELERTSGASALLNPSCHGKPAVHEDKAVPMLAVIPEYVSPRLTAQRAAFVAFGDQPEALEEFGAKEAAQAPEHAPLQAIVIPRVKAMSMRYELDAAGIAESTIFPDVSGLALEIAQRWDSSRL